MSQGQIVAAVVMVGVPVVAVLLGLYARSVWWLVGWAALVAALLSIATSALVLPSFLALGAGLTARWFGRRRVSPALPR